MLQWSAEKNIPGTFAPAFIISFRSKASLKHMKEGHINGYNGGAAVVNCSVHVETVHEIYIHVNEVSLEPAFLINH